MSKFCVSVNSKLTPLVVRLLVFAQQVLGERKGQPLIYRSGLGKILSTVFLRNARVVLKPMSTNNHNVPGQMTTINHVILRPTKTSNHVLLRPTATSQLVNSNRTFLLLDNHQALMIIITIANLHAQSHVLSFWINKWMVIRSHALAALIMINVLEVKLRRRMKGRQGRNLRNKLVVVMLRSRS